MSDIRINEPLGGVGENFEIRYARFETAINARLARHEEVMRQHEERIAQHGEAISRSTTQIEGMILPAQKEVATKIVLTDKQLDEHGVAIDHVINTIDSMLVPTQKYHTAEIQDLILEKQESRDFRVSQQGAWAFIQKAGIVIAAVASVITLAMKIKGL